MPTVLNEGTYIDEVIQDEENKDYRQSFIAEGAIVRGQVCKTGTAGTQKAPVVTAGTGANAVAINNAADGERVWCLVAPGGVTVKRTGLTYGSGATSTQMDATDALLRAQGIVVLTRYC